MIKHIAFFSRAIPLHGPGGMEVLTWDLARAFVRRGIKVTLVTSEVPARQARFCADGIDVIAIPGAVHGRYTRVFWKGTLNAYDTLADKGVDAIIGVSSGARAVALQRPQRGIPILMQAHGSSIGEFISKWRKPSVTSIIGSARNLVWILKDRQVLSRYDALVSVSESVRRQIEWTTAFWKSHVQIQVIRNGVDSLLFSNLAETRQRARAQLGFGSDTTIIISSSRLHRQKGVAQLMAAFHQLSRSDDDARLVLLGDGPDRGTLEKFVQEKGLQHRVKFIGSVSRPDVAYWLSAANVFCFLTLRVEGQPLNQMEALAAGLPSVLSESVAGCLPLQPGILSVDPNDPQEVANALRVAIELAKRGLRTSLPKEFTLDRCVADYLRALTGMIEG